MACKPGFFLPVRVLSRLFRRRFLEELEALYRRGRLRFFGEYDELNDLTAFAKWLAPMRACEWVVYAKRPFAGPKAVLAYLSPYTHRVAISNQRLVALNEHGVTFRWKDYRVDGRTRNKTMTPHADEFVRRFLLHALPGGYGLSSNWTVGLTCSLNSRFGSGDVRSEIFEATPLTAQGFTRAFRDHLDRDDCKLLVGLRTLPPLLIE